MRHRPCAKTAEPIELPFQTAGKVGQKNCVVDGCEHWRHLANTVEQLCAAAE